MEVEGYHKVIVNCGKPIVLSLSPGETSVKVAAHARLYANLLRMADDFRDNWVQILKIFRDAKSCEGKGGRGYWPDCDMIHISKLSKPGSVGPGRFSRFTEAELYTHMSFWCLYRSPLRLGGNLPENR